MKEWINKFEKIFISIPFAETDEHGDARNMFGIKYVDPKNMG